MQNAISNHLPTGFQCHPPHFGTGDCRAWDAQFDARCIATVGSTDRPAFCDEPWCYVELATCFPDSTKTVIESKSVVGGAGLAYYSYETCGGDASTWAMNLVSESINGKTLKVGVPYSWYPDHFMTDPVTKERLPDGPLNSDPSTYVLDGIYVRVMSDMASKGGFTIQYQPVSASSLADHTSSWTACVQVSANNLRSDE